MSYPAWLDKFIDVYSNLTTNNLDSLSSLYHAQVKFRDPMHQLTGSNQLLGYFESLYTHLSFCHFDIEQVISDGNQAAVYWTMCFKHKRLKGGKEIKVEGATLLRGENDQVIFHRDYVDLGSMLYEHVPVMGTVIQWIKRRASQ